MRKRFRALAFCLALAILAPFAVPPVFASGGGETGLTAALVHYDDDDDGGDRDDDGGDSSSAAGDDDDDDDGATPSSDDDDGGATSSDDDGPAAAADDDDDDRPAYNGGGDEDEDEDRVPWIERVQVPAYAKTVYTILSGGGDDAGDLLRRNDSFQVSAGAPSAPNGAGIHADQAEVITFALQDPYAESGAEGLNSMAFTNGDFYAVELSDADQAIDYARLKLGDVVRTATFNGVFVTKLAMDAGYERNRKDAISHIATVYQAFDRDNPEIFWLSGKCRVRTIATTAPGGAKTAYLFLTLADTTGFTMLSDAWRAEGALAEGIRRRDAAVERILTTVTGKTDQEKLRQINRWLTENNQYNTTPDLTTIGNEPHECLSALEGRTGTSGPVCDGYARAFKVLCDRLGIDCVLENGYAKTSPQSQGVFHMWNAAQVGSGWYGVDVTWNDPTVRGSTAARSGREHENYLLVGADSLVGGMLFRNSHPATNRAIAGGTAFSGGPALSAAAYTPATVGGFTDVLESDYFAQPVLWAVKEGITSGTAKTTFPPGKPAPWPRSSPSSGGPTARPGPGAATPSPTFRRTPTTPEPPHGPGKRA